MPPRRRADTASQFNNLSFEKALSELETLVEAMESTELPLEELINRYELGSNLLKHCKEVLSTARGRIELITVKDDAHKNSPKSITHLSTNNERASVDQVDDNDITLF